MSTAQTTSVINEEITRQMVADKDRSVMLPKYFPDKYLMAEPLIYAWMSRLCLSYDGGYWNMYELSNGAFYMSPATGSMFVVMCPGWCMEVTLSADAAGLVACLYALNQLSNQTGNDGYISLYYNLRDYALTLPEADNIFRAID